MPSAPPVTAVLNAFTISLTLLFSEPVHWYEQPSSLQASSAPYLVGTKNGFVVTWLTKTNFSFVEVLKMPLAGVPLSAPLLDDGELDPQAARAAVAMPAADPVSADRRGKARHLEAGGGSCLASSHSRRSIASWTGSMNGGRCGSPGVVSDTSLLSSSASPGRSNGSPPDGVNGVPLWRTGGPRPATPRRARAGARAGGRRRRRRGRSRWPH